MRRVFQKQDLKQLPCLLITIGTDAGIVLSIFPVSRNVSEGKMVEFSCASPETGVYFSWNTLPNVGPFIIDDTTLPGGSILRFTTTTAQHNNTIVRCTATKDTSANISTALLLIQGITSQLA